MRLLVGVAAVALFTACAPGRPAPDAATEVGGSGSDVAPAPQGGAGGAAAGADLVPCEVPARIVPPAPDEGSPSNDCRNILRPLPEMKVHRTFVDRNHYSCTDRGSDGAGDIAVLLAAKYDDSAPSFTWEFLAASGAVRIASLAPGHLFGESRGWVAYDWNAQTLGRVDALGRPLCAGVALPQPTFVDFGPRGDLIVSTSGPPLVGRGWAGVDGQGRVLVLQAATGLLPGEPKPLWGRWFDVGGEPLTDRFVVADDFPISDASALEIAPLYDGVAIGETFMALVGVHRTWLLVVASGSTEARPAPGWLASRRSTRFVRTRGGYAVIHDHVGSSPCGDRVEILTAAGEPCTVVDLPIASGPCSPPGGLTVGLDGTLFQRFPTNLEEIDPADPSRLSCTIRYWPAALP